MTPNEMPPHIQMLTIMMGHWVAQIAATVARFQVADHLAKGPRSAQELSTLCEAHPETFGRLLRAAASTGILKETDPGLFALTPLGDTLRKDAQGSLHDLVIAELAPGHWLPWGRLYDAVKTGQNQAKTALGTDAWAYYEKNPQEGAHFARGMSNLSAIVAAEVLPTLDLSQASHIVDVGGSEGVMLAGALHAAPKAKGTLFDLPEVIARGADRVRAHGLEGRLEARAGDFLKEVPRGADTYILKSVLHDWDDAKCSVILNNIRSAAKPGAKVLIVEMIVPEMVTPSPVHLMDINMLVMLNGKERTEKAFRTLLENAGLRLNRVIPSHGLFCTIEAQVP